MPGSPAAAIGLVKGDRIVGMTARRCALRRPCRLQPASPGRGRRPDRERAGRTFTASTRLADRHGADRFGQSYRVGRLGIATGKRVFEPVPPLQLSPKPPGSRCRPSRTPPSACGRSSPGGGRWRTWRPDQDGAGGRAGRQHRLVRVRPADRLFLDKPRVHQPFASSHARRGSSGALRGRGDTPPTAWEQQAQEWLFRGGFAALMTLMLVATLNDLASVGLWQTLGRLLG
jgi:regulator of sigma E protease